LLQLIEQNLRNFDKFSLVIRWVLYSYWLSSLYKAGVWRLVVSVSGCRTYV